MITDAMCDGRAYWDACGGQHRLIWRAGMHLIGAYEADYGAFENPKPMVVHYRLDPLNYGSNLIHSYGHSTESARESILDRAEELLSDGFEEKARVW
jgi:hypothetical protein